MSRFATLDSLKKKGRDDDDDDEKTNEYYAGGAGSHGGGSGLNVVGRPGEEEEEERDSVQRMFNRAMREAQNEQNALRDDEEFVTLTMYRNGFTVDNGPFRELGVPENDEFVRYVSEGRCPPELIRDNKPPNVKLENKRDEDYVPPPYVAFGGDGLRVGGGIKTKDENTIITPVSGADLPEVNEKEAIVRVQIKFPDRSRLVAKFNKHHTVHDLISVIHHSNKVDKQFVILAPNPPKPIEASEFTKTIIEAGLANASVTVSTNI